MNGFAGGRAEKVKPGDWIPQKGQKEGFSAFSVYVQKATLSFAFCMYVYLHYMT